ncbi:hypothetical protein ABT030_51805, partial [Streptomyces mirabilis]
PRIMNNKGGKSCRTRRPEAPLRNHEKGNGGGYCGTAACGRRTFVEQVPGLTRRHGRVTERLRQAMGAIGLALAGRAGAHLARVMGIATSRTTLLRRVMDLPDRQRCRDPMNEH